MERWNPTRRESERERYSDMPMQILPGRFYYGYTSYFICECKFGGLSTIPRDLVVIQRALHLRVRTDTTVPYLPALLVGIRTYSLIHLS